MAGLASSSRGTHPMPGDENCHDWTIVARTGYVNRSKMRDRSGRWLAAAEAGNGRRETRQ